MDFEVLRTDLRQHRIVDGSSSVAADGEAVLRIDECALTANNITYAAFGEAMRYWDFFPAHDAGWGRIPVWGFADVEQSRVSGLLEGDRVYGYFPMSTHLAVAPIRVTDRSFVDGAAHRSPLPPVYNQYQRVTNRTTTDAERLQSVLRPLFTTSFLIDDWLDERAMFGARSVVVASASSKTGLALAASLQANRDVDVVGLTSARNADFVASTGYYDRVVVYGEVAQLDASVPTVLVDMGGDSGVLAEVHHHFGDHLRHSCQVGATHWEQVGAPAGLPGPRPTLFFAPDQIQRRVAEWGGAGYEARVDAAYAAFAESAARWMDVVVHRGPAAVAAVYPDVLEGRITPSTAVVIALGAAGS
jgi:hypothetical protein